MLCPCHSNKKYEECCKDYHNGSLPKNALLLMRSRYSAYALELPEYIIKSTHPDNPEQSQDIEKWKKQIVDFCRSFTFVDLKILEFIDGSNEATVHFVAFMKKENQIYQLNEKSLFYKVKGQWLYHSPLPLSH